MSGNGRDGSDMRRRGARRSVRFSPGLLVVLILGLGGMASFLLAQVEGGLDDEDCARIRAQSGRGSCANEFGFGLALGAFFLGMFAMGAALGLGVVLALWWWRFSKLVPPGLRASSAIASGVALALLSAAVLATMPFPWGKFRACSDGGCVESYRPTMGVFALMLAGLVAAGAWLAWEGFKQRQRAREPTRA